MAEGQGDPVAKRQFAALVNKAVTMAAAAQVPVEQLRGVAFFDSQRMSALFRSRRSSRQ